MTLIDSLCFGANYRAAPCSLRHPRPLDSSPPPKLAAPTLNGVTDEYTGLRSLQEESGKGRLAQLPPWVLWLVLVVLLLPLLSSCFRATRSGFSSDAS